MSKKGFLERLENGGNVIMAEGFVFEFERRGYLSAGPFVPEVVLDYPHLVKSLSEEFVHAGSEVVLAFTGPIAAFPVPFRTSPQFPTMQSLINPYTGTRTYPDVSSHLCGIAEVTDFAKECKDIGVQFVGLCCGNTPAMTRAVAEVYGRRPPASAFSPNMDKHYIWGKDKYFSNKFYMTELREGMIGQYVDSASNTMQS